MNEVISIKKVSVSKKNAALIEQKISTLDCNVKSLREMTDMNRKEFADYFKIPYRTVEDWEHKKSSCSPYLFRLMYEKLLFSGLLVNAM